MPERTPRPPGGVSRRTVLKASTASAGLLAATSAFAEFSPSADAAAFVYAADVSWAPQMEAAGYSWKNSSGQTQDLLTILKGYGITAIRLRTFVNPSSSPTDGHCSISEVAAFAKRVKAAGMSIMLDYMFGDTWNSVGVQYPPAAWKNMTYSQMLTAMNSYVNQSMTVMKNNDVLPAWVQIGNEINGGICHPIGSVSQGSQMTGLLNAAYNQVKQVSPSTIVCIHLAQPQKYDSMTTFYNAYHGNGGRWDMSVFSSYGSASLAAGIVANMKTISDAYGKPFMQTEFGGPVSKASSTEAALVAYIKALKSAGGQGISYWEPAGYSPFTSYDMVAWDSATHQPTSIMNGFLEAGTPTPATTAPTTGPTTGPTTSPTPAPTTSAPGGAVSATYRVTSTWSGGYQAEVTVTAGGSAVNGWTTRWTLDSGQSISQVWNGTLSTSGSAVTVRNASYNGSLPAGTSTTFGLIATGVSSTPSLTVTTP
jgi:arabinogalactan endo-1,4-beta-galactosidase